MEQHANAVHQRWDELPWERVTERLSRKIVTGQRMMITHVALRAGCLVPLHAHEHEQISYVLTGALRFWLGAGEAAEEVVVRAGAVLLIPSGVPHRVEALEDTLAVDIFCPPRQDWLDKTDDYLRG